MPSCQFMCFENSCHEENASFFYFFAIFFCFIKYIAFPERISMTLSLFCSKNQQQSFAFFPFFLLMFWLCTSTFWGTQSPSPESPKLNFANFRGKYVEKYFSKLATFNVFFSTSLYALLVENIFDEKKDILSTQRFML